MGFFLQLRLLLWKNFTLKRRKPVVLMFELIIPLVLFIILVGIRSKQPAVAYSSQHFPVWPLPSAGLISVMQAFCDKGESDQYGFYKNKNATVTDFLSQLNSVAENNNFFQPKFTLDELNEIPRIYKSIVEDPISLKEAFYSNKFDMRPVTLLNDVEKVERFLVKNMSFDAESTHYVLHSVSVNKSEFYSLIFKSPSFLEYFPFVASGENVNLLADLVDTMNAGSSPNDQLVPENNHIDLTKKKLSAASHLTMQVPAKVSEASFELLNSDKMGIFELFLHQNPGHRVLDMLRGNFNFTYDESLNVLQDIILNTFVTNAVTCVQRVPKDLTLLTCKPENPEQKNYQEKCRRSVEKFVSRFCELNIVERKQLHDVLVKEVNTTFVKRTTGESWNYQSMYSKVQKLAKDINTFILFKKTIRTMANLSLSLPHDYCGSEHGAPNVSVVNEFTETGAKVDLAGAESIMQNRIVGADKVNGSSEPSSLNKKPNLPYALLKIWKSMQKTVCGKVFEFIEEEVHSLKDMGISKSQLEKLELLIHVLYNNPKVLYTPTGTHADLVIQKANETFVLFDKINQYAKRIYDVGAEIKDFLNSDKTIKNLVKLKEIQNDLVQSPMYSLLFAQPAIQEFLSDPDITTKENFVQEIDTIMMAACSWQELMKGLTFNIFKGFRTEDEMLAYFKNKAYFDNITVLAGIVFHMNNDGSLPNHMIYKIRQNASLTIDTKRIRNRFWFPGPRVWGYNYYYFGFVWVQDILERAMVSLYAERDVTGPGTYLQQFPYPCYIRDTFLFMIQHVMPLCLTISWVYSVAILVQHIVYEKEQRLKEVMKMMGLKNGVLWIAWFLTSFSQMTVTIGILTLVLRYGKVLTYSNPWIVFLTLEVFSVAIIMLSFLVSSVFSKAKLAAACAGIIYFMSYVPYMYIAVKEESANEIVPAWVKATASLLAPTAFGLGAKYFAFYEEIGTGMQWDNINKSPAEFDTYNLGAVLMMLVADAVWYGVLFWYIENIHPGPFGLPRPWYFPLQRSYWLDSRRDEVPGSPAMKATKNRSAMIEYITSVFVTKSATMTGIEQELPSNENTNSFNQLYEPEPDNLALGVVISGLSKRYKGSRKYALKDLNLNLHEGQITALLGHNGAGKTTTMSILTGLFPPTSGYALIYGRDIRVHMDLIRGSLGMCPQHNVLFDDLTLEEHMWFYSRLKGEGTTDFDTETNKLIVDLKIPNKRHHKVSTLSGGMKRKLSVAIAFVGGSKTVILDEPTAGVDPYARRAIWDLIIKYKKGRTILLSTHHMDEADILGDKIAIMDSGKIKCCGSPLYLKNHLGEGYHLFIVKTLNEEETSISSRCSEREVTMAINRLVPTARLVNESKHELHYVLPLKELRRGNFVPLFHFLSSSKDQLFISSFGVKNTTLEEIFIKVISERRNSDTSSDKILPTALTGSLGDSSRQGSLSTIGALHSRQLSLNFLPYAGKQHSRQNSADVFSPKMKHTHKRQNSADIYMVKRRPTHVRQNSADTHILLRNSADATAMKFQKSHSRQSSDAKEPSIPLLSRRQHSHDSHFPLANNPKASPLSPEFERELKKRLASMNVVTLPENGNTESFPPDTMQRGEVNLTDVLSDNVTKLEILDSKENICIYESEVKPNESLQKSELTKCKTLPNSLPSKDNHRIIAPKLKRNIKKDEEVTQIELTHLLNSVQGGPELGELLETEYTKENYLLFQQFWALICKRYLFTRKNIEGIFSQILLPAFFVSVAMSVALTAPTIEELNELILSPSQFHNLSSLKENFIPFSNNKLDLSEKNVYDTADSSQISATLLLPSGVGATCVLKNPFVHGKPKNGNARGQSFKAEKGDFDSLCAEFFIRGKNFSRLYIHSSENIVGSSFSSRERKYPICTCNDDNTGFVCPSYGYSEPEFIHLVSNDILIDISGQNESQYYLHTTDKFRTSRYGGLSFGLINSLVPPEFGESSPSAFRKVAVRHAAKIWFNNQGFHSIPIFVNAMNNAILRANIPHEKGTPAAYGITVINHPFPNSQTIFSQDEILQGNEVLISIFIIVAMSFVPASFVLFLVYERSSKAKHLQIISGVHRIVYWVANYIWDILNYTVPAAFCILILLIFDVPAYTSKQNFPAVVSLFLMYGWSITPVMYPASFIFKDPSSAYISLIVGNLFVGITCIVTSFLLEVFSYDEMLGEVHSVLKTLFLLFPNYCLGRGLMEIAFNEYYNQFLLNTGQYHKVKSPFAWDIISRNLIAMAATGATFFIITILCEYNFFRKPRAYKKFIGSHNFEDEDEDVFNEKKRVARGSASEDILSVKGLTKVYHTRKTGKQLVVDQLSWGVPPGECFGLLGVNGAGKSTTFKMLTGDTPITKGDAFINGFSVKSELYSAFQYIGYCPQFDALYDELTAREHLNLYATLRGVLKKSRTEVVDWALTKLDLLQYADRPVGTYSGGNKRKLSTAIALIGGPSLIFLDEPTTGMDPYSKRFLWDFILKLVKEGKSIVFTSHSMEECEMLCTRLAIMVNGHFKCLGSTQHLKNKFGDGYSIKIKCLESDTMSMESYMKKNFPFAVLTEKHYNCLHYELSSEYVFLDDVFSKMENAMKQVFIRDYSVSQNTLDNVFINFVKDQNDQFEMPQASLAEPEMSSDEDFNDAILENSRNSSQLSDTFPNGNGELLPDIVP